MGSDAETKPTFCRFLKVLQYNTIQYRDIITFYSCYSHLEILNFPVLANETARLACFWRAYLQVLATYHIFGLHHQVIRSPKSPKKDPKRTKSGREKPLPPVYGQVQTLNLPLTHKRSRTDW